MRQLQSHHREKQQHADSMVDALVRIAKYLNSQNKEGAPALHRVLSHTDSSASREATDDASTMSFEDAPHDTFSAGKRCNDAGDFWGAQLLFAHAYLLRPRTAVLLSLGNMSLKVNEPWLAASVYRFVCEGTDGASQRQVAIARTKLAEAEQALAEKAIVLNSVNYSFHHTSYADQSATALVAETERSMSTALERAVQRAEEAEKRAAQAKAHTLMVHHELCQQLAEPVARASCAVTSAVAQLQQLSEALVLPSQNDRLALPPSPKHAPPLPPAEGRNEDAETAANKNAMEPSYRRVGLRATARALNSFLNDVSSVGSPPNAACSRGQISSVRCGIDRVGADTKSILFQTCRWHKKNWRWVCGGASILLTLILMGRQSWSFTPQSTSEASTVVAKDCASLSCSWGAHCHGDRAGVELLASRRETL